MKKKVLILGSNGMAGHVMTLMLKEDKENFNVVSVAKNDSTIKPDVYLDVTNFSELRKLIKDGRFDVIINCVGILNRTAEENPDIAVLINSYLPHSLVAETKKTQTRVIHISTDCVFSGAKGAYLEDDFKDGTGFYAQSKALGELVNSKDLTIRTSIIGPELKDNGIGLFHWFMNQDGEIKGYDKAIWSGVTTVQLAKNIIDVISLHELTGLVHLTNNKGISKYELLKIIKEVFGRKEIRIIRDTVYQSDKSLKNTRTDFRLNVPDYRQMIIELKKWIEKNSSLYSYPILHTN